MVFMQDPEFQLLLAACKAALDDAPVEAPPPGIDWDRLLRLADRHRVQALCWNALGQFATDMPKEVAAGLQAQARGIVVANLRAAAECARLNKAFDTAGVPLLFLKGLSLGALAYRNPYLKMGVDIDLLVEADRLPEAADELRSAGYVLVIPQRADESGLARWHESRKESVWRHGEGGFQVDLHTRLADHPDMLHGLTATSPSQQVCVADGISLPTLSGDHLFAYLCVHGASSAWFRLKWITDFAGILSRRDEPEIERLYEQAQKAGAGRAAGQALLLADRLYSIGLGDKLRSRLTADPIIRWMVDLAERQLLNPVEPTERPLGTATIHLSQLGLMPGWRFRASEAARQIRDMIGAVAL